MASIVTLAGRQILLLPPDHRHVSVPGCQLLLLEKRIRFHSFFSPKESNWLSETQGTTVGHFVWPRFMRNCSSFMSCVVALKLKEKTKAPEMGILVGIEIAHLQARILLLFHYELSKVFTTLPFCPRQIKALLCVGQKRRLKPSILTLMAKRLESNNFSDIHSRGQLGKWRFTFVSDLLQFFALLENVIRLLFGFRGICQQETDMAKLV